MNFSFDLKSMVLAILIHLVSLVNWSLNWNCRCWVSLRNRGKIHFNTWLEVNQTIFWIRSAQVDVSSVNEIPPLLSCPFRLNIDTHVIIN